MAKGTRITLTKSQADSQIGQSLVKCILDICHDGAIEKPEIETLHQFLTHTDCDIAAVAYLRAITREILADGQLNGTEAYRLKQGFERVVPKAIRGVVSTHLEAIGLPSVSGSDRQPWYNDAATERQIEYIIDLGGTVQPGLTKGEASALIDGLLEHCPPTPRQKMLLRFFDRVDLMDSSKVAVSEWVDELFMVNPLYEGAWQQFKIDTRQDCDCQEFKRVPVGGYRKYVRGQPRAGKSKAGCVLIIFAALAVVVCMQALHRAV